jgi:hypothetical protein
MWPRSYQCTLLPTFAGWGLGNDLEGICKICSNTAIVSVAVLVSIRSVLVRFI